jgi:hypothetical protein
MLEQPSSGSTSRIRPSWPRCRSRLSLLLVSLSEHTSCYHAQPSILLFISVGWVSHLMPSLLSGWLLTNVQVNNIIMLHNTHGHTYIQHIGITILLFFSYSVSTYCPQTIVVYSLVYPALLQDPKGDSGTQDGCRSTKVFLHRKSIPAPVSGNYFVNTVVFRHDRNFPAVLLFSISEFSDGAPIPTTDFSGKRKFFRWGYHSQDWTYPPEYIPISDIFRRFRALPWQYSGFHNGLSFFFH